MNNYTDVIDVKVDQSEDNPDTVRWVSDEGDCAGIVNGIYRGDTPSRFISVPFCM